MQWVEINKAYPTECAGLLARYSAFSMVPEPGCMATYYPYKRGYGAVVEVQSPQGWLSFLADIMPPVLADKIQVHQSSFYKALDKMTAADLHAVIPVVIPKCTPIPGCEIPGLGKFPIEEYKESGKPIFTDRNWWLLARAVAQKDMLSPHPIFEKSVRLVA